MSTAEFTSLNGAAVVAEDKAHQKSFKYASPAPQAPPSADVMTRRKYKKLRHTFKDVMRRSDELFKQEQLAKQAIRRMQEENT